jgi:hypothetical protein
MRMDCTEAKRIGVVVLAGDASREQAERLEAHLHTCRACAADWQERKAVAETLQAAAPPALETQRDLVREAMQQAAAGPEPQAVRLRARYRLVAWAAAALIVVAAAIVMLPRPSKSSHLLAVVEAAMAVRPTHEVHRTFDARGKLLSRMEVWYSPGGDCYYEVEDFAKGTHETKLNPAGSRISWQYKGEANEYILHWSAGDAGAWRPQVSPEVVDGHLPGVRAEEVRQTLALVLSLDVPVDVSDREGQLRGQSARIIEITVKPSPEDKPRSRDWGGKLRFYLTLDGSRLVGHVSTGSPAHPSEAARIETWPIEYDTKPPASLFEVRIPEGARAAFEGEPIDRVWEWMSQTEQEAIRGTVLGVLRAWTEGNVEAFGSYCDFAAGLQYGVKGKFTAEKIRERSLELVAEQKTRFADQQWTMDYAYETTRPPGMTMVRWHIYRTNPQSDGSWILLRQRPIEEPGVVVLARGQVTTHEGEVGYLGMCLFLKKIGGTYKLALWREPFGGYGY